MNQLEQLRELAKQHHSGHYCIFAFSGGFKACLGTANIEGWSVDYDWVHQLPAFKTAEEAIQAVLDHPAKFDWTAFRNAYHSVTERGLHTPKGFRRVAS